MLVVVAMPCLDEEKGVERACRSLGFGSGSQHPSVASVLALVDNGSSDGTLAALERVAASSPTGSVRVVCEPTIGFVPARHRGAMEARRVAQERGISEGEVLLVQADADTLYMPDFLATMARCSLSAGLGVLVEGYSEAPLVTEDYAAYRRLETMVDGAVAGALLNGESDIVIDDKVAAVRLSDYFAWGGHRREWANDGDEVLAETTRLYMRGRLRGGQRCRAEAFAWTSLRRIEENPGLAFATAGHPRGPTWQAQWCDAYDGPSTVKAFDTPLSTKAGLQLVHSRVMHIIALFKLLPAWMAASLSASDRDRPTWLDGSPSDEAGKNSPGAVIDWAMSRPWEDVLELLDGYAGDVEHVVAAASEARPIAANALQNDG